MNEKNNQQMETLKFGSATGLHTDEDHESGTLTVSGYCGPQYSFRVYIRFSCTVCEPCREEHSSVALSDAHRCGSASLVRQHLPRSVGFASEMDA